MDRRQQNHEDEGDDRRETVCNHDHDHRTMCFNESRCSQSLRTRRLDPRMHGKFARGKSDCFLSDSGMWTHLERKFGRSLCSSGGSIMSEDGIRWQCSIGASNLHPFLPLCAPPPFPRPKWLDERVRTFWFLAWCTVRDRGRDASDEDRTSFRRLCGRSAPSGISMRFTFHPSFTTVPRQCRSQIFFRVKVPRFFPRTRASLNCCDEFGVRRIAGYLTICLVEGL